MTSALNVTAAGAPLPAGRDGARRAAQDQDREPGAPGRQAQAADRRHPSEAVDAVIKASAEGVELGRVERTYVSAGRRAITLKVERSAANAVARAAAEARRAAAAAAGDAVRRRRQRPRVKAQQEARGPAAEKEEEGAREGLARRDGLGRPRPRRLRQLDGGTRLGRHLRHRALGQRGDRQRGVDARVGRARRRRRRPAGSRSRRRGCGRRPRPRSGSGADHRAAQDVGGGGDVEDRLGEARPGRGRRCAAPTSARRRRRPG